MTLPPGWDRYVQPCPSCREPVLWTITERGKRQPIDPAINPLGNTAVRRDGTGTLRSRGLSKEYPTPAPYERVMVPHAATCKPPERPQGGPLPRPPKLAPAPLPENVIPLDLARQRRSR